MRLLLDTNVIIRSVMGKLTQPGADIISDTGNQLYYSPISIWEMVSKQSIGKLSLPVNVAAIQAQLDENGCRELPVTSRHAQATGVLATIHNDPFDRMLLAQAFVENMTLITSDDLLGNYPVNVMVID